MRIIYFDIDCLRPDHLGCYGYNRPTSPAIDGIAAQGTRFDHYYCASSPCLPSRTALFSGRFGIRNGVISNFGAGAQFHINTTAYGGPLPENEMFMRQLRKHGYDTISFSNFADRHYALWFMYGWTEYHTPNLKGGGETADEVNLPLLRWLKQNASRENYFLHINYWDVHRCYKMDACWADRFKNIPVTQAWPDSETIARHQDFKGLFTARSQFRNGKSEYPLMPDSVSNRQDFEKMVTGYDAAIAYVDSRIAQVLEELDRQKLLDDAVLIISGDHGDAFGEHGIYSDHVCADECIQRVPLIMRWPGVSAAGKRSSAFLYNIDLAPTVCDLLGIAPPSEWDGSSFKENIGGGKGLDRDFLVWDSGLYTVQRVVRTKTHLLMRTFDNHKYPFEPVELYDMVNDPYQTKNIAAEAEQIVNECSAHMQTWKQEQMAKSNWVSDPVDEILRERKARAK